METIRKIILKTEESDGIVRGLENVSSDEFKYNAMLAIEAGLVKGKYINSRQDKSHVPAEAIVTRLTWDGHDFADVIKDEDIWKTTRERFQKVGSWTFDLLLECLKQEAKIRFRLALGS